MLPVFLLTCPGREAECAATLADWALSDWGKPPEVFCNPADSADRKANIRTGVRALLRRGLDTGAPRFLIVEDDIRVHRHLRRALSSWPALSRVHLGSLYDCGVPRVANFPAERCFHADPRRFRGAQARIFSSLFAHRVLSGLEDSVVNQDIQIAHLAGATIPIVCHTPSLVQHAGRKSTWGGMFHQAWDFNPTAAV